MYVVLDGHDPLGCNQLAHWSQTLSIPVFHIEPGGLYLSSPLLFPATRDDPDDNMESQVDYNKFSECILFLRLTVRNTSSETTRVI